MGVIIIVSRIGRWNNWTTDSNIVDHVDALVQGENAIFVVFYRKFDRYYGDFRQEASHYVAVLSQVALQKSDRLEDSLVE